MQLGTTRISAAWRLDPERSQPSEAIVPPLIHYLSFRPKAPCALSAILALEDAAKCPEI